MTISRLAKKATGDFRNYDCLYEWLLECIAHSLDPNAPKRDDPIRMKRILADIFAATME